MPQRSSRLRAMMSTSSQRAGGPGVQEGCHMPSGRAGLPPDLAARHVQRCGRLADKPRRRGCLLWQNSHAAGLKRRVGFLLRRELVTSRQGNGARRETRAPTPRWNSGTTNCEHAPHAVLNPTCFACFDARSKQAAYYTGREQGIVPSCQKVAPRCQRIDCRSLDAAVSSRRCAFASSLEPACGREQSRSVTPAR